MKLAVLLFLFSFLVPQASQAYFTTNQSATRLTSDTILFTVTYKFGFSERELYMPIGAIRGLAASKTSAYAGYTILNEDDEEVPIGTSNAIILTDRKEIEVKDNQYYLPAGGSASFTLITLLTIPEDEQTADLEIALEMSNLPFTMIKDGTVVLAQLNPSELQYYRTPVVGFAE